MKTNRTIAGALLSGGVAVAGIEVAFDRVPML
jgi:hypothetical protein